MTPNNNISVLPWYERIDLQNSRKSYAYGNIYPLYTQANFMLPFQIMRPLRPNGVESVKIYHRGGGMYADVTEKLAETGLYIAKFPEEGYDVIVYTGILPMALNQADGVYYAVLSDGVQTWYSEMYTVVQSVEGYMRIQWWDAEDLVFDAGRVVYENPRFKNTLYLCAELGKPEYEFEEEGEERDGYFFPEKQISEKTYRCTILAPEYLCDVMRLIRMADYVEVRDKYGQLYRCDTFLMTPEWQVQGDLASVEIEFQTDTVVKKIGRGYIPRTSGDFNDDFNKDFDNA